MMPATGERTARAASSAARHGDGLVPSLRLMCRQRLYANGIKIPFHPVHTAHMPALPAGQRRGRSKNKCRQTE
jgi:hypothetical protein